MINLFNTVGTKYFCGSLVAMALLVGTSQDSFAQKDYGSALIKRLQTSNSSAAYSIEREQRRTLNSAVSGVGVPGVNNRRFINTDNLIGSATPSRSKPFQGVSQGPSVSPYLRLSDPFTTASDYQTLIRPQREMEQARQRQQVAQQRETRRLNQMAAQAPISIVGDPRATPTGHSATHQNHFGKFQNTGGFFAPPTRPKRGN